ncbi:molecular chaperone (small heat shock protein) [Halovivax ruber XH-70]|uniref:Molecular chaperone (Small heat shock protein) n=1 Tax=Halovivax ruber (strain DSM 18193 / JCM 13892 / XH-70) TaxID=797302 RepID=L0IAS8_HALRX|nr:molecular chaperone (small heat shock protein) [Halovivax ruber XH-70]
MPVNLRTLPASVTTQLYRGTGRLASAVQHVRSLDADLLENDRSYLLLVDTPGADAGGLDIRYYDGHVQVTVERERPTEESTGASYRGRAVELSTEITLPDDAVVDPEAGTARLSPVGTVKIELPKATETEPAEAAGEEIPIDD